MPLTLNSVQGGQQAQKWFPEAIRLFTPILKLDLSSDEAINRFLRIMSITRSKQVKEMNRIVEAQLGTGDDFDVEGDFLLAVSS